MPKPLWIHRLYRATAGTLALAVTALVPLPAPAADEDHVPDELLIGFHDHVAGAAAEAVYRAEGGTKLEKLARVNVHRIRLHRAPLNALEQRLRHRSEVKFVERNRRIPVALAPNDPVYGEQWHLPRISAPQAWDVTTGSPGVVIGILDSGIDASHPDLASKLVPGWNFYDGNANTWDVTGHGTRVAGAAAAIGNNGVGVAGVALGSRIMPLRVTDGGGWAYYSTIASALTWAADNGVKVMNLSFAGIAGSSTIRNAAQYVKSRGGLVVAAAGNCYCFDGTPDNPEVISVSSTGGADTLSEFSSRGNYVDLAAPGEGIRTTERGGGYSSVSGTSFSSPITAGVIALMMAVNPSLAPGQVEHLLEANTDDLGPAGWDASHGSGRLNASRAVRAAAGLPASGPSAGGPASLSLAFAGFARDRVGQGNSALAPDGIVDGTFTLTLAPGAGARTITQLELRRANDSGIWDTVPGSFYWALGVAGHADGPLLNAPGSAASFALAEGATVTLFAADAGGLFAPGSSFTVAATFADGSVATASATIPAGAPALSLAFAGFARDRVGQGASALASDGVLDGTFFLTLAPGAGSRTITQLDLRRANESGVWDTVWTNYYWSLGVADSLDGALLNGPGGTVSFTLGAGGSVALFAADAGGLFAPGSSFTITATFSDGSTAIAGASAP
jgi:thermitase